MVNFNRVKNPVNDSGGKASNFSGRASDFVGYTLFIGMVVTAYALVSGPASNLGNNIRGTLSGILSSASETASGTNIEVN